MGALLSVQNQRNLKPEDNHYMVSLRKVDPALVQGKDHRGRRSRVVQAPLSFDSLNGAERGDEHLNISQLETWVWDAACAIRGAQDAPKFKDFILPLLFYKRLSDSFDDTLRHQVTTFGAEHVARSVIEADLEDALKQGRQPIVGFYVPAEYRWPVLRNHPVNGELGQFVTSAMRKVAELNPALDGVLTSRTSTRHKPGSAPWMTIASRA